MRVAAVRVACLLMVSFAAVLAATGGALGASVPQGVVDPVAGEKGPPPLSDAEVAALEERRRLLESPAAAAERTATRDRFVGLADDAALVLARETFPGAASEPLAVGGRLGAGEAIAAYRSEGAAVVREPDGSRGLLASSVPLRSALGSGWSAPGLTDA